MANCWTPLPADLRVTRYKFLGLICRMEISACFPKFVLGIKKNTVVPFNISQKPDEIIFTVLKHKYTTCMYVHIKCSGKGKVCPRTGREGPEGE